METSNTTSFSVCFNPNCKQTMDQPKKGWRLRSGGFTELCDRCGSAYEEGKFCETFHLNASGWRCCETCGKQIHCGCIVSFNMFVLLDAGGIECLTCARKRSILDLSMTSLSELFVIDMGFRFNHNGLNVSTDNEERSGKDEGDAGLRGDLFARYLPRTTDQELLQICGENHIITPLFEKTLSASDAGPMGRLILPKKCAEVYLPSISSPEGLPLEVRDYKGNEWLFQFRFWPNNNSRMYVLEGVTPFIQSLELQAGDIVTFSRIEPRGKLIVGSRKASSTTSMDQGNEAVTTIGRSLMIENRCMIELKLNSKEAQGLIRPPHRNGPKVIVIEGCEIEEYEDAPIIGRPSTRSSDYISKTSFKKMKVSRLDPDSGETSLHATTRHPRHKPGCRCIVCMQPPSNGPKHKQSCECAVCESVKRRFRTFMTRRHEKKQLEKDAEITLQKLEQDADVDLTADQDVVNYATIDLNSQPERDKEMGQ